MESDNTLLQKLRGLLPEKTIPFLITDLGNQLELMIEAKPETDDPEKKNPFQDLQTNEILGARIDEKFYTRENARFVETELGSYLSNPEASIFISKEMSHGVGLGYFQAHSQVMSRVLEPGSRYKPIYRRVEIVFGREIGSKTFYCLMGAAMPKPTSDKAAVN